MTCKIDRNRPCTSKSRSKNRYTRKDLEELAKKCGITNIRQKTMDMLCKEIAGIVHGLSSKECSKKSPMAFKPNYECNATTGRWKRKPGSLPYHYRYELEKFSNVQLNEIAMKLGAHPPTDSRDVLIEHILEKQYPIVRDKRASQNLYVKKFKRIVLELRKRGKIKESTVTTVFYYTVISSQTGVKTILTEREPLAFKSSKKTFKGYQDLISHKTIIGDDITGIKNNEHWFATQKAYQMTLPFVKQLMILTYTHAGDRMIHSYMDHSFKPESMYIPEYKTKYVFPLYPAFLDLMRREPEEFRDRFLRAVRSSSKWGKTEAQKMDVLRKCGWHWIPSSQPLKRGSPIFDLYDYTLETIFKDNPMDPNFYEYLMDHYIKELDMIIMNSPPLMSNLIVYKGTKTLDYLDFSKHNIYRNKRYISTTLDFRIAKDKAFTDKNCCLQKILLLRGTKLLYPILTYYLEQEILLPRGRHLYATSEPYTPKNNSKKAINIVITN